MKTVCSHCGGFGHVTYTVTQVPLGHGYFRDEVCEDCMGEGEVEATCLTCETPLREDGWCPSCEEGLTEVRPDPFGERFAA